jgi:hypothetical protein
MSMPNELVRPLSKKGQVRPEEPDWNQHKSPYAHQASPWEELKLHQRVDHSTGKKIMPEADLSIH